jgi:hypothetical protein
MPRGMPRAVKVLIWVVVFSSAAGAGAYVAAHTDPFPPGVEDPGARTTKASPTPTSTSPSEPKGPASWSGTMASQTYHQFHVGGRCTTRWASRLSFTIDESGQVTGDGQAQLQGDADCDFPTAQVQTKSISLRVSGEVHDGRFVVLRLAEAGRDPVGSHDLGGLVGTLKAIHPAVKMPPTPGAWARASITVTVPDGDLGRYVSVDGFAIRCVAGCG